MRFEPADFASGPVAPRNEGNPDPGLSNRFHLMGSVDSSQRERRLDPLIQSLARIAPVGTVACMTLTQLQKFLLESEPSEAKAVCVAISVFCEALDYSEWPKDLDELEDLHTALYEALAPSIEDAWTEFAKAADDAQYSFVENGA
jgi:hypothetical protein